MIEEFQGLQTHLNLMTDLAGSLVRMLSTMSSGRSFFLRRRIGGSVACDIFSTVELIHRDELREIEGLAFVFFFFPFELVILFFRHVRFMFSIFWAHFCAPRPKALCSEVT